MKLKDKRAMVTGADSGIGAAIAIAFAHEGADVVVHYHSDADGARRTADRVRRTGRRAQILQADLSNPRAARQLFDDALAAVGRLDIVVNNAGVGASEDRSLDTDMETFTRVLNVDLVSPYVICRAAAQHMLDNGGGAIVNITSVHEEYPLPGAVSYNAAKAGLRSVSRSLALELSARNIRINSIAPGMIDTPMNEDTLSDPEDAANAAGHIPMRRPGRPEEVAKVAVFLASDDASYVTGSSYVVDGGLSQNIGGA